MLHRSLGKTGPRVSALGLGCMGMSPGAYGPADRKDAIATVHAALEAGIDLFDTGDFYAMGHNELLVREALAARPRDSYLLSVKFGAMRDPKGLFVGIDGRPAAVKNFLAYSLQRLGTDYVDVYRLARVDPSVPIEETIGACAEMVKAGYVRHVGLSEAGAETIRRAHAVHPICDVQLEYSLMSRSLEPAILPTTRALGIAVTAYGILSRGLMGGHWKKARPTGGGAEDRSERPKLQSNLWQDVKEQPPAPNDFRAHAPRFQGGNLERNLALVDALAAIAKEKKTTVAALAIAWVLGRGDDLVPLVGARTPTRLAEALTALDVKLTAEDAARMEAAVPPDQVAGTRYAAAQMAHLDSEK